MAIGATRTLIIAPAFFKENTVVDSNVEDKIIEKCTRTAEDKFLLPIIGSQLYTTIINSISGGTLAGDYKILVDDYITPCLLEYTLYEYIPFQAFKIKNKGIGKQTGPDNESASLKDLNFIRENVKDSAQFYAERLIKHLKANVAAFPEYFRWSSIEDVPPARSDYFSGIQFPGMNRGNCDDWGPNRYIDFDF